MRRGFFVYNLDILSINLGAVLLILGKTCYDEGITVIDACINSSYLGINED